MLRRAGISMVIALIAAVLGFTGLLDKTAPVLRAVCFIFAGLSLLSLLFSLFEDNTEPGVRVIPTSGPKPISSKA